MAKRDISVLETGDIYFVYQPKVDRTEAEGIEDLQRFYIVLRPQGENSCYRRLVVGAKRMPKIGNGGEKKWAFVDLVTKEAKEIREAFGPKTYQTKTRGERTEPAARPVGSSVYALARHGDHTHLLYELELPEEPREAQAELNIESEGSYIVSVRNPEAPAPPTAGLGSKQTAEFPPRLQNRFEGKRFAPVDPPDYLDHEGSEFLLIGASETISDELGIGFDTDDETEKTAGILSDLRWQKGDRGLDPLFKGKWT
jgi:hypothetical protein